MKTVNYKIPAGCEILSCSVDFCNENTTPSVMFLHGGGASDKDSSAYLSPVFHQLGKSVIRFDFSGQGGSSGSLKESSLQKRNAEAKAVLDYFGIRDPLTVVGSSMGGYIASTLVRDCSVDSLILFCPAAYTAKAWDAGFSSGFTELIRAEKSFLETDIPEILEQFKGRSLFIIGSADDVIPREVVDIYTRSLGHSIKQETLIIEGCPHQIHLRIQGDPELQKLIEEKILSLFW